MNRRWRQEAAKQHDTLQSVSAFTKALPPLTDALGIADVADLYATYSTLHAKNRHPQARRAPGFHYFLADAVQSPAEIEAAQRQQQQQHRLPLPPQRVVEAPVASTSDGFATSVAVAASHVEPVSAASTHPSDPGSTAGASASAPSASKQHDMSASAQQRLDVSTSQRYEAVVPVGSKYPGLTMELMQRLFLLEGPGHAPCPHIMLAIVDDDGSVSLARAFNYVQPPFEGPETLPPISAEPPGDDSDA